MQPEFAQLMQVPIITALKRLSKTGASKRNVGKIDLKAAIQRAILLTNEAISVNIQHDGSMLSEHPSQ